MRLRRTLIASLIAGLLWASLGGVAVFAKPAPVNLTVWTNPDPIGIKWWRKWLPGFEKQHPNIHVKVLQEDQSNDYAKYTSAITGNKAPDLMMTYSYPIIPTWAASGFLKPMNPYLKQLGFKDKSFFPIAQRMDTYKGKTYALLQAYDDLLFVWNKDAFKKAGLNPNDPPHTIAEMTADAKKLTIVKNGTLEQAGFIPFVGAGTLDMWDDLYGGTIFSNGKFHLDSPQMRDAMQLQLNYVKMLGGPTAWQNFYDRAIGSSQVDVGNPNAITPETNKANPFYTGQLAMELVGDYYPTFFYKVYAKGLNFGESSPPVGPGVTYGTDPATGGDMFAIPENSRHPLQAAELAVYMDGQAPALDWDRLESNMPPTASLLHSRKFATEVPTEAPSLVALDKNVAIPPPTSPVWSQVQASYLAPVQSSLDLGRITAGAGAAQVQQQATQAAQRFTQ